MALPASASGDAAVDALGLQLPAVANAYGWTPAQLTARLTQDASLNVDKSGYLFYKDPAPSAAQLAAAALQAPVPLALQPLANTFTLHSLPGEGPHQCLVAVHQRLHQQMGHLLGRQ